MTTAQVERAVVGLLDTKKHIIIPNLSWGLFNHELDLAVIDQKGRLTEIEIKVSKADLRRDLIKEKWKKRTDKRIGRFIYAVPEELLNTALEVARPEHGIIVVVDKVDFSKRPILGTRHHRIARHRADSQPLSSRDIHIIARLLSLRYWEQKSRLIDFVESTRIKKPEGV